MVFDFREPLSGPKYISHAEVLIQQSLQRRISSTVSFGGSHWIRLHFLIWLLCLKSAHKMKHSHTNKSSRIL